MHNDANATLIEDKIKGGIFGVAVGDALGATVELLTRDEITKKFGFHNEIIGGVWLNLEPGEFTDDTEMTLAVANGIIANPDNPSEEIGKRFVEWFKSKPKSIGTTTRISIGAYLETFNWAEASNKTKLLLGNRINGNGCLMRTLPISFAYLKNTDTIHLISREIAAMTHPGDLTELSCVFYNYLASRLIKCENKNVAFNDVLNDLKPMLSSNSYNIDLYSLLNAVPYLDPYSLRTSAYVVDTLVASLVTFLKFDSIEQIITEAVNLGGDSDTIGAVAGGLAGTFYGFSTIPQKWLDKLLHKKALDEAAQGLIYLATN